MSIIMKSFRNVEIQAYDRNTGEIIEGIPVLCGVKRNPYRTHLVSL